jgi:AcrR family transcriptional regulator
MNGGSKMKNPDSSSSVARPRKIKAGATDLYRRAIVDAAEKVFGKHGFADAKMSDIARETGLAVGTLYHYFPGKEKIFQALLEDRCESFAADVEKLAASPAGAIDRIRAMVQAMCAFLDRRADLLDAYAQPAAQPCGPSFKAHRARVTGAFEQAIRAGVADGKFRRDVDAADLALALRGIVLVRALDHAEERRGRLVDSVPTILSIFLKGAGR